MKVEGMNVLANLFRQMFRNREAKQNAACKDEQYYRRVIQVTSCQLKLVLKHVRLNALEGQT